MLVHIRLKLQFAGQPEDGRLAAPHAGGALTLTVLVPDPGKHLPQPRDRCHVPNRLLPRLDAKMPVPRPWHASCCYLRRLNYRRISDMPLTLNAYLGIQPDALKVFSQRAEVLAANLANADTPGYQARDIDFRSALAAADPQSAGAARAGAALRLATTSRLDVTAHGASGGLSTAGFLKYRIPLAPSLDGNTVSSQLEEAKFAENTVRFQAALTFLEKRFTELNTAITGQ